MWGRVFRLLFVSGALLLPVLGCQSERHYHDSSPPPVYSGGGCH